ncbi:MAG: aminopeptidase P family protein [Mogibacterium sp.]|nr:aminopeptidase P family protein [Mogibacterium sp.]
MKKEIVELRELMWDEGIDVYYIPSGDFHSSEYVHDFFKAREFMSNLTGEAGDMLITEEGAWLWTDGRFFLQAEQQLAGTGIELMRMAEPGVPTIEEFLIGLVTEFRKTYMETEYKIGFDGRVVPAAFGKKLEDIFFDEKWNVAFRTDEDLVGRIWTERPKLRPTEIWDFPISSAGLDTTEKLAAVRAEMEAKGADYLLITDLMENAWLFNLRASDILYTPVFFSFALITRESADLYVMDGAFSGGVPERLSFVNIKDYGDIYKDIAALDAAKTLWYDSNSCNYELYCSFPPEIKLHAALTPVSLMKMIKNDVEIASARRAHIKDGIAVTKLIKWVKEKAGTEKLTEISVADKLEEFCREQEGYLDLSFETISGYGSNGAIIHYAPTAETNADIRAEGFLLLDSGRQFVDGTTDITRTIALGELTQEMIDDYTYVLRAHIDVHLLRLEPGMNGVDLDTAGRGALKEAGLDFKHGLAHGVGHVLGVHEGPNTIRRVPTPIDLEAGMIMSNEPGVYFDGRFGIRIENLMLFSDDGEGNIVNEPLTCVPYERRAINKALMTEEEIAWLNDYHAWVRDSLLPHLDVDTAEFLREETKPI